MVNCTLLCRLRGWIATLLALALVPAAACADGRDWYSAGHGDVDTRAFVVELPVTQVQALLPVPLGLDREFPGRQAGTHPVIFLFSTVMPRKAHLMPIYLDMPYREFALFIPEVRHPELRGTFIHSSILYLDSRMAVWIGRWPYRFPKIHAELQRNEGTRYGEWTVRDGQATPVLDVEYTLADVVGLTPLLPQLDRLDTWFSLPLINGREKFTCSRMDWEITNHASIATLEGSISWREDWLADDRRLPAFATPIQGIRLQTLWYLSMPHGCGRYRRADR